MNASKCYHCQEGERREVLLIVFNRFCEFLKGAFCRISFISRGRNDRLKPGRLLNLTGHIQNKTGQFSISLLSYFTSSILQTLGLFIDSPGSFFYPVVKSYSSFMIGFCV